MGCACPSPEDIDISLIDFIKRMGDIEASHMEDCELVRSNIEYSGRDEREKRLDITRTKVEHKVKCRIDKIEEYKKFVISFPNLKDAACRYL